MLVANKLSSLINRTQFWNIFNLRKYSSVNHNVAEQMKSLELSTTYRQTKKNEYDITPKFLMTTVKERNEFLTIYPRMVDSILSNPEFKKFDDFHTRLADMLDYLINSRLNRGSLTCYAYKEMKDKNTARVYTEQDYDMCKIAGWAMEMAEAYIVILDDMVDLSGERRGMACWHRFKNHGILTTYDCFYVKLLEYKILQEYCGKHPSYVRITEILHFVNYQVQLGQVATFLQDLTLFTIEFYKKIVRHKTEFFMYYQPVILGVLTAYVTDEDLIKEISDLTIDMGLMYQIQNDVMDAYGPYSTTGKVSNDIQQGTCTWIVSKALELANARQKKVLFDNYGRKDVNAEKRVLDIYAEINIRDVYKIHKQGQYNEFKNRIDTGSSGLPKETMMYCLKHASMPLHDGAKIDTTFEYV